MKKLVISLLILSMCSIGLQGFAYVPEVLVSQEILQAHEELLISEEELNLALLGKKAEDFRPSMMPVRGRISSDYGIRRMRRRKRRMHKGIDIAAPVGTPVRAPAAGRVAFVGRKGAYGLTVMLEHGGHYTTLFAHNSKVLVEAGDIISKGDVIARVGNSGRSTGPHLHYEVRLANHQVNPVDYL